MPLARVAGPDAPAGRRRPDQSRGLLQHRRNVTACPGPASRRTKSSTCAPTRSGSPTRSCARTSPATCRANSRFAFDGCASTDCIQGAINDVGLRAVIRDGKRGFRMIVGGGLGPLPTEAQLLDEFVPEERLLNKMRGRDPRLQPVRQSQEQEQGAPEVRDARARLRVAARSRSRRNTTTSSTNGGIAVARDGARGLRRLPVEPATARRGRPAAGRQRSRVGRCRHTTRWLETNVQRAEADRLRRRHRHGGSGQPDRRPVARPGAASRATAGDGLVRITINQNLLLAFIPLARLPRSTRRCGELGLGAGGARARSTTCSPAPAPTPATWG